MSPEEPERRSRFKSSPLAVGRITPRVAIGIAVVLVAIGLVMAAGLELSEAARIYGADHLTQDACPGLTDGHLGVKARRRCGLRCRAHDDR